MDHQYLVGECDPILNDPLRMMLEAHALYSGSVVQFALPDGRHWWSPVEILPDGRFTDSVLIGRQHGAMMVVTDHGKRIFCMMDVALGDEPAKQAEIERATKSLIDYLATNGGRPK